MAKCGAHGGVKIVCSDERYNGTITATCPGGEVRQAVYTDCPYRSQAQRVYICQTCNSVIDPVEVRDE